MDQFVINPFGKGQLSILSFQGEGVIIQPGCQRFIQGQASLGPLGRVDVQINKAGPNHLVGWQMFNQVLDLRCFQPGRIGRISRRSHPVNPAAGINFNQGLG